LIILKIVLLFLNLKWFVDYIKNCFTFS